MRKILTIDHDTTIYFGDICYIMDDDIYDKIWGDTHGYSDGEFIVNDGFFIVSNTSYGDGEYSGTQHDRYPVDAGVLGLVSKEL